MAVGVPAVPVATDVEAASAYYPAGAVTVAPDAVRSSESFLEISLPTYVELIAPTVTVPSPVYPVSAVTDC